jgi:GTP cyclohydrolase FolE2
MSTHQVLGEIDRRPLPDVVSDGHPAAQGRLDRVGMNGIETIVTLPAATGSMRLPARVACSRLES